MLPWLPWLIPHVSYHTRHWQPVAKPLPLLKGDRRELDSGRSAEGNIAVGSGRLFHDRAPAGQTGDWDWGLYMPHEPTTVATTTDTAWSDELTQG